MKPQYNFGLSQEDVVTEIKGLDLTNGDSLLCIAGGGEIPLTIAGLYDVNIVAVDYSENQLRLCRLKQVAANRLEPTRAAGFLGYIHEQGIQREHIFLKEISPFLEKDDVGFWMNSIEIIRMGVIHAGKFEQFIAKASLPARWVIGKKNLGRLFDCHSIPEQEILFDRHIAGLLLKLIFVTAFHPRIYKNRGIDAAGMQHRKTENIGNFFFNRFRSFCCSTPARENFLLQYVFFRRAIFPEALPAYLKNPTHAVFLRNNHRISFVRSTLEKFLAEARPGQFNKILLSNVSDWMPFAMMEQVFGQLQEKTTPGARMVFRHIYAEPPIGEAALFLKKDYQLGNELIKTDRFPFSSVVPIRHVNHRSENEICPDTQKP